MLQHFLMASVGKLTPLHDLIVKGTASDLKLWKWVEPTTKVVQNFYFVSFL